MAYPKPSKQQRNETYLRSIGFNENDPIYKEETVEKSKLFLIVCEGANTEPAYFESFPVPTNTVITIGGKGSKSALIAYALKLRDSGKYQNREIWCVFDFDIKPDEGATQPEDFNRAILKAEQNGLKTAWSNDAFELWFALHYHEIEQAFSRYELYDIMRTAWQLESFSNEAKTRIFCEANYERHGGDLSAMQALAIRRAKRLHGLYGAANTAYHKQCPCTTVYQLVEELNKYIKK